MCGTKPCMAQLTIKKYVKADESCPFQEWYDGLGAKDRAAVSSKISMIEQIDGNVSENYLKKLGGDIWEIRAKGTTWHRPLCVMRKGDLIILLGVSKKAKKVKKAELQTAERLAKELNDGQGKTKYWSED